MPTNENFCSLEGKFGKRILLEKNLGNNCLMVWGRHIREESIQEIVDWIYDQWGIMAQVNEREIEGDIIRQYNKNMRGYLRHRNGRKKSSI